MRRRDTPDAGDTAWRNLSNSRPNDESSGAPARPARLLTAQELAARWSVPASHVYRMTRERGLPTVKIGRYYRYRLAAVREWEREQEAPTA